MSGPTSGVESSSRRSAVPPCTLIAMEEIGGGAGSPQLPLVPSPEPEPGTAGHGSSIGSLPGVGVAVGCGAGATGIRDDAFGSRSAGCGPAWRSPPHAPRASRSEKAGSDVGLIGRRRAKLTRSARRCQGRRRGRRRTLALAVDLDLAADAGRGARLVAAAAERVQQELVVTVVLAAARPAGAEVPVPVPGRPGPVRVLRAADRVQLAGGALRVALGPDGADRAIVREPDLP